jgi:hypothetical protein
MKPNVMRSAGAFGLVGWLIVTGVMGCSSTPTTPSEVKQQDEFDRQNEEREKGALERRQIEQGVISPDSLPRR